MTYKIYAALADDINSGWIWIGGFNGAQRSIVKLTNLNNNASVYCEALKIDSNFKRKYKDGNTLKIESESNTIIANEWYRKKLAIHNTDVDENIKITEEEHLIGRFMASVHHPQVVVRLATRLGIISTALGIVSILLSIKGTY